MGRGKPKSGEGAGRREPRSDTLNAEPVSAQSERQLARLRGLQRSEPTLLLLRQDPDTQEILYSVRSRFVRGRLTAPRAGTISLNGEMGRVDIYG